MSDIDYDKYLRAGKGFPVIHTMISRLEETPVNVTNPYPAPDNYHSISESLGDFSDSLIYKSFNVAPSISFTDMQPSYSQGKFRILKYRSYSATSIDQDGKENHHPHPNSYVLRLGDEYVSILLENFIKDYPIFAHEYLFIEKDGFYCPTRKKKDIIKAADIGAAMLALQDDYDLIVDTPL